MDKLQFSEEACVTLVEQRLENRFRYNNNTYFVTISPNPSTKHKVKIKGRMQKIRYDRLPQRIQLEYCLRHVQKNYLQFCKDPILVGTVEHNEAGNVHLHFLINSKSFRSPTFLDVYRRDILFTETSAENLPTKGKKHDFMNNIVQLHDLDETLEYLDKKYTDNIASGIYKNYFYS